MMPGANASLHEPAKRIALAHEPAFVLGRASVQPSTRMVAVDGISEIIEPRMMQVLVVLARANGEVITRDQLVDLCWDGRIVGEDAISRVLWRLRQLAAKLGHPGFEIQTIPRVGYRLLVEPEAPAVVERATPSIAPQVSRRAVTAGAVVAIGALAIGGLSWASEQRRHTPPPEAKRYYELAIALRWQESYAQAQQNLAYLREAIRIDPEYSDAWGALAVAYACQLNWFAPRPDAAQLKIAARSAAQRTLALDRDNPDAKLALLVRNPLFGRWDEVEAGLRDILSRNPDYTLGEGALAFVMMETGRISAALDIQQRRAARDSTAPSGRFDSIESLLALGRLDEAGQQLDTAWRLWPRRLSVWVSRMRYLLVSGQSDAAVQFVTDKANQPVDGPPIVEREILIAKAYASRAPADVAKARDALVAFARDEPTEMPAAAMELAFIGELDLSFAMFEGYFFNRGPWKAGALERYYTMGLFKSDTDSLRKDSRFAPMIHEIGLDRYWSNAGVKPDYLLG